MAPSQDWIQIPRPDFDDKFSDCVAAGDCQQARSLFDQAFWDGYKIFLTWEHLNIALKAENKEMLKLLVTWGAAVTDEEMRRLRAQAKDKYPHYIRLLRQAGLQLSPEALKEVPYTEVEPLTPEAMIPQEWKQVLRTFQQNGAKETFIGGAALCGLFNERGAGRKVDIFINSPHGFLSDKKFLKQAFNATGLEITEQLVNHFPDTGAPEAFPPPKTAKLPFREGDYRTGLTESWAVVAGPQRTQYNIVFVDRGVEGASLTSEQFIQRMLNDLDFGLDQIAYDGKQIITTPFYDADVKNKQITLKNLSDASREQLLRLVKKYPDWKLCAQSKELLKPPKPPSHWYADLHGNIG
jgi:hypothetical protein